MADEMNLFVYSNSYKLVGIVDKYTSLIWTDRYDECGDFELTLPYDSKWNSVLRLDYFCRTDYSDRWAVIEKIEETKEEDGPPMIIVSGRSLECILQRRVVIGKVEFGSDTQEVSVQNSILSLIYSNIISPTNSKRRISNFYYETSTDSNVTGLTFSESYDGNDLLDIIYGICSDKHIGCKLILDSAYDFVFKLFCGRERKVIFSPYYDNLKSSDFFTSSEEYRNLMYVSIDEKNYISVYNTDSEPSGLFRREVYESDSDMNDVDVNAIETTETGTKVAHSLNTKSSTVNKAQVRYKARKKLALDYKMQTGFEGEIIPESMYKYRTHFDVGDRVYLLDSFGNSKSVYISEVVISYDENGLVILPTFKEIDWM